MIKIRISSAAPEADLGASMWPGVSTVYYPRVESVEQLRNADAVISKLERLRGIRPGTVKLTPLIESACGVTCAAELIAAVTRIDSLGIGPHVHLELGGDSLDYAQAECELAARAHGTVALDIQAVLD